MLLSREDTAQANLTFYVNWLPLPLIYFNVILMTFTFGCSLFPKESLQQEALRV